MLLLASDENFNNDIVRGLLRRNPGLDIARIQDVGLSGADDPTILEWAASRILSRPERSSKNPFRRSGILPNTMPTGTRSIKGKANWWERLCNNAEGTDADCPGAERPDRVPTGEMNAAGELAEEIIAHETLFNRGRKELQALWDGRRNEAACDCGTALVELAHMLEWDFFEIPTVPADVEYHRPKMTGEHSWIDDEGHEVHLNPEAGHMQSER